MNEEARMYAVAVGEMFDGITFHGPFPTFDDAEVWAAFQTRSANTWIVSLESVNEEVSA